MHSKELIWREGVNWEMRVSQVIDYYMDRPRLKFGPTKLNKAYPFIDHICAKESITQMELMTTYDLVMGDIMTILSNVTMAIQGNGKVASPELGGWYTTSVSPYTYIVCPGFTHAWKAARAKR